jgi:hypothetical protein
MARSTRSCFRAELPGKSARWAGQGVIIRGGSAVSMIACRWNRFEFWGHGDREKWQSISGARAMVGLGRVELPTRSLGNCCSIHLSYRPTRESLILYPKSKIATKFNVRRCGACRNGGAVPAARTAAKKFVQTHEFSEKCSEAVSRCYPNARRDGLWDAGQADSVPRASLAARPQDAWEVRSGATMPPRARSTNVQPWLQQIRPKRRRPCPKISGRDLRLTAWAGSIEL